jgi:hypothetical protein
MASPRNLEDEICSRKVAGAACVRQQQKQEQNAVEERAAQKTFQAHLQSEAALRTSTKESEILSREHPRLEWVRRVIRQNWDQLMVKDYLL